jgi:uncharacterized OB-fold protein
MASASVGPDAEFREHLEDGRFMIQKCGKCGAFVFYPRLICTACGAGELVWHEASGSGTVYSTTVVRRRPEQGGDYNVALIDLAEGPRLMSRVVDVPPAEVAIGMPVHAAVDRTASGPLLVFRTSK